MSAIFITCTLFLVFVDVTSSKTSSRVIPRKMPTIGRSPKVSARSAAAVRVALSKNLEKRKRSEKPRNLEIAESWDLSCISSTYVTLHASSPLPLHRVPRTVQHPSAVCRPCLKVRITKYKVLLSTKWLGSLRTVASLTLNVTVWSGKIQSCTTWNWARRPWMPS